VKKTTLWWTVGIIVVIAGLFGWSKVIQNSGPNIIARNGLHWHPVLTIYADGEKQEIPANIGLVGEHQSMHTHAEDSAQGVIHLEFGSIVRPDDVRLGNFFRIWNKDIMSAFGELQRMTVNGKENAEYGNYQIHEEDKIELHYAGGNDTPDTSLQVPAPGADPNSVAEMIVNDNSNGEE